jgi:hypothetical protein
MAALPVDLPPREGNEIDHWKTNGMNYNQVSLVFLGGKSTRQAWYSEGLSRKRA